MASRQHQASDRERRAERMPVDESTRLRPNSWSSTEVRIVNLSPTGFRAECDMRLLPGSCVSLDVPGIGSVDAQVEWQRGGAFGAKFIDPIDLDRCAWRPRRRNVVLAELLVERAAAANAGRDAAESGIRHRILSALPIHRSAEICSGKSAGSSRN